MSATENDQAPTIAREANDAEVLAVYAAFVRKLHTTYPSQEANEQYLAFSALRDGKVPDKAAAAKVLSDYEEFWKLYHAFYDQDGTISFEKPNAKLRQTLDNS